MWITVVMILGIWVSGAIFFYGVGYLLDKLTDKFEKIIDRRKNIPKDVK